MKTAHLQLRAALTHCMHRNLCDHEGILIYALAEDDAEVFTLRRGSRLGDGLLRRLAAVPGREQETVRVLQGGRSTDEVLFDSCGLPLRIRRPCR